MNIKEVSEKYDISRETLRYWERIGAIPKVNRNVSGYREFDQEDEAWVNWTNCMRKSGVSIERIVEYIDLFQQGDQTIPARKALLIKQLEIIKNNILEIQKMYDTLDDKIEHYDTRMRDYEGKLKKRGINNQNKIFL